MRSASGTLRRRMHNRGDGRALRLRAGKHSQHLLRIHAQRRCAFLPAKAKRKAPVVPEAPPMAAPRRERILESRTTRSLSIREITEILKMEGMSARTSRIHGVLKAARLPKRPRRRPANSGMIAPRFRNHCTGVH